MNPQIAVRVVALAIPVLLLMPPGTESAPTAPPGRDSARGMGAVTILGILVQFQFSGSSDPDGRGGSSQGQVTINGIRYSITCLRVSGRQAEIHAPVVGRGNAVVRLLVHDGGDPGAGVDRFGIVRYTKPIGCLQALKEVVDLYPIETGNIQVNDSP